MTNWKNMISHFTLTVWNDLIPDRNGAGFKRNMQLLREDVEQIATMANN